MADNTDELTKRVRRGDPVPDGAGWEYLKTVTENGVKYDIHKRTRNGDD